MAGISDSLVSNIVSPQIIFREQVMFEYLKPLSLCFLFHFASDKAFAKRVLYQCRCWC
jgi:hypothetical protein